MPKSLLDSERLDARFVLSISRADKERIKAIAERTGLAAGRVAREALLAGLPLVATRRRRARTPRTATT